MSTTVETLIEKLAEIRRESGPARTTGIADDLLHHRLQSDTLLAEAIEQAHAEFKGLGVEDQRLLHLPEEEACREVQLQVVNFYPADGINPYLPLAARGPWIVSFHGAVIHDNGGYGMLGLGHNPPEILRSLGQPMVMANVMTPNRVQKKLCEKLSAEIGYRRGHCPMPRFIFLNSGSEAVTLTARIVDIHAKKQTTSKGKSDGRTIRTLGLEGGFHGRTYRPAQLSESTRSAYDSLLASFQEDPGVDFVPMNDIKALRQAFQQAEQNGVYFQALYIEPVMGEGLPGVAVTREFYDEARRLCDDHGALLIVDSIQAALRAQGCLSLTDYPGFEDCASPDMETFSKALNAGQYPLSVIALREEVAAHYVTGVYGNTMTTNPKALAVACHVLDSLDDGRREHIRNAGRQLKEGFENLAREVPGISRVDGTGLMVCAHLDPELYTVNGRGGFEEYLRLNGIEMIHGGEYGLRFTPHFALDENEIELILHSVRAGLKALKKG